MAQGSKFMLSEAELQAISRPDFFYIKHSAMNKVMELLGETERRMRPFILSESRLHEYTGITPKIFRGENYLQLPYMVLDFPRRFSSETIFAFRTMFWWGKEFSFTLHLQGNSLTALRAALCSRIAALADGNYFICVHKTPWQYTFEEDNYLPLSRLLKNEAELTGILERNFIKLSRKLPIEQFEQVPEFAETTFRQLTSLLF